MPVAIEQGLGGLLAAAVAGTWPASPVETLQRHRRASLLATTRQLEMAADAGAGLLAAGIRTLPLKGAAVAELLYDNAGDRPMADVDLLALDDADGAVRWLEARGFVAAPPGDHATPLQDPRAGQWIEVHRACASCPSLHPADAETLWDGRRAGTGRVATLPSLEDLLLQMAVHATFQHALGLRLVQYVDIVRLARHRDLDVTRLGERASRTRTTDALALALAAAGILAGDVPLATRFPLPAHLAPWAAACASGTPPPETAGSVARLRWALARGRRLTLLRDTLAPATLEPRGGWRRAAAVARRVVRLARASRRA